MSIGAGLLVTLAVTWLVALALYVYALRLEYRDGKVLQRPYEPAVNSVIWDSLKRRYQSLQAVAIPGMSGRWVREHNRAPLP